MPESASPVKIAAVRRRRAEIVFCAQAERESTTRKLIEERGATLIHPFEHPDVIAGQGTAALELLEQAPELDAVVTPVGGGGLFAGTSITVKTMRPDMEILGAEPEAVDDAYPILHHRRPPAGGPRPANRLRRPADRPRRNQLRDPARPGCRGADRRGRRRFSTREWS